MAKVIVDGKVGSTDAEYALKIEDGKLKAEVAYPVAELLAPVKAKLFDRLKEIIPGTFDDMLLDKVWDEVVGALTE